MSSVRLFVYGSLKRGGRHHDELAGAVFLGEATTLPGYRLDPLGEYLALVSVPPHPEHQIDPGQPLEAQALEEAQAAQPPAKAQAQPEPEHETDPAQPPAKAQAQPEPEHETDPAQAQPEPHETETATAVPGELFEVDESKLSALDAFEGDAYERGNVRLAGLPSENGGFALAYFRKAR